MTRSNRAGTRLGLTVIALALGAVAMMAMPALAAAKDRNHDRIPDRWEKKHHLSLQVNQARLDQDRDHLRNRAEFLAGDNPRDRDSNDDGVMDGEENAGTIQSFDPETGKLTIALFGNETLAGFVTEGTEIKCEDGGSATALRNESGGDGESQGTSDDNGGEGEEEPGDDNGGEQSGDDGDNEGSSTCASTELVPGAVVQEAELRLEGGKAVFEEIELSGKEA
jgi:hypothetical protein